MVVWQAAKGWTLGKTDIVGVVVVVAKAICQQTAAGKEHACSAIGLIDFMCIVTCREEGGWQVCAMAGFVQAPFQGSVLHGARLIACRRHVVQAYVKNCNSSSSIGLSLVLYDELQFCTWPVTRLNVWWKGLLIPGGCSLPIHLHSRHRDICFFIYVFVCCAAG